jgi:hydroxyacylglutathione hydrolase
MDVRSLTVGRFQENCYIARVAPDAEEGVIIDPGDEAPRILALARDIGIRKVLAILVTHCHIDHIGAVAPVAQSTGAPVYCPQLERGVLADIMGTLRFPGLGPFESYEADHTVAGGEHLQLAGLDIDVLFTPGHSIGHVTYSVHGQRAIFSGDVLFAGSVGRVDLPGGDWPTLAASIGSLVDLLPGDTRVHPGHGGATTLAAELASNPFLAELRAERERARPSQVRS